MLLCAPDLSACCSLLSGVDDVIEQSLCDVMLMMYVGRLHSCRRAQECVMHNLFPDVISIASDRCCKQAFVRREAGLLHQNSSEQLPLLVLLALKVSLDF